MRLHEICPVITEDCDKWLESIGYYEKPASTKYHGCKEGDLFKHSLEVANALVELTDALYLEWQRKESPMIVGLLHDVCKCDDYVLKETFPFDEKGWEYNKNKIMDGHGDKSVIMLAGHIQLTEEEVYCIRYHMGAYTDKEQWQYYNKAVKKYPNVLFTHTADMIASHIIGI